MRRACVPHIILRNGNVAGSAVIGQVFRCRVRRIVFFFQRGSVVTEEHSHGKIVAAVESFIAERLYRGSNRYVFEIFVAGKRRRGNSHRTAFHRIIGCFFQLRIRNQFQSVRNALIQNAVHNFHVVADGIIFVEFFADFLFAERNFFFPAEGFDVAAVERVFTERRKLFAERNFFHRGESKRVIAYAFRRREIHFFKRRASERICADIHGFIQICNVRKAVAVHERAGTDLRARFQRYAFKRSICKRLRADHVDVR